MYRLTLTKSERAAIDWVGHRDWNGDPLSSILLDCMPEDVEWGDDGDITFEIPEHKAWEINDLYTEADYLIPHFAPELAHKLQEFLSAIV
jgi:hypothetical protein